MKILRVLLVALAVVVLAITTLEIVRVKKLSEISQILIARTLAFEQNIQEPSLRILIIGDSTGVGIGATTSSDSVAGRLGKTFPEANIRNVSRSGARVYDGLAEIKKIQTNYDVVILMIGGNDALHFTNFKNLKNNTRDLLKEGKNRSRAVILMPAGNLGSAPIIPQAFRWLMSKQSRKVRNLFEKLSKENNVIFVDLFQEHENDPFARMTQKFYAPDGFHPSNDGYALWFSQLVKVIRP